ncbi:MAG: metallophosphoesterase [Thermomicrobiales bacterium]|nr:metallophosphoesterase [Thermomicrobiales bacterium]
MPKRWIVGGIFALGSAMGLTWLYARRIAPSWLETVRLRVAVPGLPAELDGLKVAHLSDAHAGGPGVTLDLLWKARRIAEAYQPDIIALTGDFYHQGQPVPDGDLLGEWPESAVVLAVLGNHDLRGTRAELDTVLSRLEVGRVRLLRNEAARITLRGCDLWVAGVDDPYSQQADISRACADVPDEEDVLLLLAHSPAIVNDLPTGRVRLVLSGHTHGGQIRLLPSGRVPFQNLLRQLNHEPPRNDPPFYRGIHWVKGGVVVISTGLGMSEWPLRFLTRPQVILIELSQPATVGPDCDEVDRYVERVDPPPWYIRLLS